MLEEVLSVANMHDADPCGNLRPSPILRLMQDAANAQMRRMGLEPRALLEKNGTAFLLSSLRLRYVAPVHPYDALCAQSWPCESRGYRFLRCGRLLRDGQTVAELATVWGYVSMADRRPLRTDACCASFACKSPLCLPMPLHSDTPKDLAYTAVGTYTVAYRDVDLHRHMNNTNYPDLLCGFVPKMEGRRIDTISIFFAAEAPLGECLTVWCAQRNGIFHLKTTRADGQENVTAQISLCEEESIC